MKKLLQKPVVLLTMAWSLSACEGDNSLSTKVDFFLFDLYGGTIFEKPPMVGLKEIHLDDGRLQGKRLVVEGEIKDIGEYDSYIIIEDESARMLVLLNKIIDTDSTLRKVKAESGVYSIRVLGTVFKGKKGLPYIAADSLNLKKRTNKDPQS